ncbi:MAG TPA: nitroreductase family protein [Kofleriaceae bacterium]|jgi:nitroreductase|nr:nitroreductase family protein [Kofleriaceae bacterium]
MKQQVNAASIVPLEWPSSGPTPAEVMRDAVAAASLAPSAHNTQPWRFKIIGTALELYADTTRHLEVIDAGRRQLFQSCGCALFNARVAVRAAGYADEVIVALGDAPAARVATLRLGAPRAATALDRELLAAIPERRTNRREFLRRPVAWDVTERLCAAAGAEGATVLRLDPPQKRALGELIDRADRKQFDDPAFRAELSRWLTTFGSQRQDGIPFVEKEYGSALPFSVVRALRSPHLGADIGAIEHDHILSAPVVLAFGTGTDAPVDWLACGQALEAILLHATALGLSASFLNQVLEVPELRQHVVELIPGIGYPQMILRLGVPAEPVHHAAPRRAVDEMIER